MSYIEEPLIDFLKYKTIFLSVERSEYTFENTPKEDMYNLLKECVKTSIEIEFIELYMCHRRTDNHLHFTFSPNNIFDCDLYFL